MKLVTGRSLTQHEQAGLKQRIIDILGHPFRRDLVYCKVIERSPGGKFEDFRSELAVLPRPLFVARRVVSPEQQSVRSYLILFN